MSHHEARHRDLTNLIDRARDWDALARLERTVSHELTPDLRVLLDTWAAPAPRHAARQQGNALEAQDRRHGCAARVTPTPGPQWREIGETMSKHTYRPIAEAPRDGTPIIAVCGGVEMTVAYDDGAVLQGWVYWDEDEGGTTYQRAKPQPEEWRRLF